MTLCYLGQNNAGWLIGSIRGGPRSLIPSNYVIPLGESHSNSSSASITPIASPVECGMSIGSVPHPTSVGLLHRRSPAFDESRPPDMSAPLSSRSAATGALSTAATETTPHWQACRSPCTVLYAPVSNHAASRFSGPLLPGATVTYCASNHCYHSRRW